LPTETDALRKFADAEDTVSVIIESKDNQQLKHLRQVRDGKAEGEIFIEGARLCTEAVRSRLPITLCVLREDFDPAGHADLVAALKAGAKAIVIAASKAFRTIADTKNSQGIALAAKRPAFDLHAIETAMSAGRSTVLFLDRASDPSNIGAVVRSAEAAGAAGVVASPGSADAYAPKALRAAMGSAFRLPIVTDVGFKEAIEWAKRRGISTVAAYPTAAKSYLDLDWRVPRMVVFGSEAHGLSIEQTKSVVELIGIPMENDVESINVAASAAVILFEAKRQRGS
jgi:TrmH family RNA methyltransferase